MTQYTYSCKMVNKSSGVPSESEPNYSRDNAPCNSPAEGKGFPIASSSTGHRGRVISMFVTGQLKFSLTRHGRHLQVVFPHPGPD
jgi:hypothetical protein